VLLNEKLPKIVLVSTYSKHFTKDVPKRDLLHCI